MVFFFILGFLQYFKFFDVDFVGQVILLIAGNIEPLFIWRLSAVRRKTIVWMFLDKNSRIRGGLSETNSDAASKKRHGPLY